MADHFQIVSKETPRIDAVERVTGQARYTEDVYLPGMLFARVLRSPLPHARVKRLNTAAAEALPGVMAILHAGNDNTIWSSGDGKGRRRIVTDTPRFVGDAVAVVAAVDRHIAEDALHLIQVEYEELPFVVGIANAIADNAPAIYPEGNLRDPEPSVSESGNIEEGFRQADYVYEQEFITKHHNNAQLERRASVAQWNGDRLTVWASTQGIYNCRSDIAKDLGLPLNKVRVICQYMGAGFGNKNQGYDFDLMAAVLARRTGRPVRVEFTRAEDFIAVHGRWATRQRYRIGVKNDGTLTAVDFKAWSDLGAYARGSGGIGGRDHYVIPHRREEIIRVHTNTACAANYRAPSGPQGAFGFESALDEIAAHLKLDPVELRRKNAVDRHWGQEELSSNGLRECLRRGAEAIGWEEKRLRYANQSGALRRGVGMATGTWSSRVGPSSAVLKLLPDGSVKLYVGVTDIGTGAKTTMSMIAAEALGVPLSSVSVISGDTDLAPYSPGESGSRTTGFTGIAVIEAARKVREQLFDQAAQRLRLPRESLELRGGKILSSAAPDKSWEIAEVTGRNIDALTAAVTTNPAPSGRARSDFAAHFAEVEVNRETGQVRVVRYVAAHDCGTIINPLTAASQVKGGVIQGIGMALREELIWDPHTGIPVNNHYHGAKVLIHPEAPEVEVIFVDSGEKEGPFGAKSVGEVPIVPVVAAVANAIFHATGARIRELPITPDKLLLAFRNGSTAQG